MFWLKRCPRCIIGDLYQGEDLYHTYIACMQCSHYLTEEEVAALLRGSRPDPVAPAEEMAPAALVAAWGAQGLHFQRSFDGPAPYFHSADLAPH